MTLQSATRLVKHNTAETLFTDVLSAYRRFGRLGERPLMTLQHFRGDLDNWPLTDALGAERKVVLVDYPAEVAADVNALLAESRP